MCGPPAAASQIRGVPSAPTVSTVLASGLYARSSALPWFGDGEPIGVPVAASHCRAVWSALPVSTVLPSGLYATQ